MADVKHCTASSPINDFEGFLHIFYCRIKSFTESLTEKLLRQVGWQGRVQNNQNSPHDVRSPDCRVLTQTYSPNFFSSHFWRVGERCFLSLMFLKLLSIWLSNVSILSVPDEGYSRNVLCALSLISTYLLAHFTHVHHR